MYDCAALLISLIAGAVVENSFGCQNLVQKLFKERLIIKLLI